ncbi:MAG: hypothetical protein JWP90_1444 [Mycetocola sp.]|jgi:hypothetical protein|nr:hypothetical protein [Mycetocola sp.]
MATGRRLLGAGARGRFRSVRDGCHATSRVVKASLD